MAMRRVSRHARSTRIQQWSETMRLFKRRRDDEVLKCASCGEIAPEGALECSMCGEAFDPKQSAALQTPGGEAREVGRHWG